jgi:hypothetical protein
MTLHRYLHLLSAKGVLPADAAAKADPATILFIITVAIILDKATRPKWDVNAPETVELMVKRHDDSDAA